MAETHSTEGKDLTARKWPGSRSFWSHGTHQVAGIGIIISNKFLAKLNPIKEEDWLEIIPGRVARLRLEGPAGNLDIYTTYLTSGNDAEARESRATAAKTMTRTIAPRKERLSLVMADFNFD